MPAAARISFRDVSMMVIALGALAGVPASPYRDALAGLARFAVSRDS